MTSPDIHSGKECVFHRNYKEEHGPLFQALCLQKDPILGGGQKGQKLQGSASEDGASAVSIMWLGIFSILKGQERRSKLPKQLNTIHDDGG